jgi:hypothetical protein
VQEAREAAGAPQTWSPCTAPARAGWSAPPASTPRSPPSRASRPRPARCRRTPSRGWRARRRAPSRRTWTSAPPSPSSPSSGARGARPRAGASSRPPSRRRGTPARARGAPGPRRRHRRAGRDRLRRGGGECRWPSWRPHPAWQRGRRGPTARRTAPTGCTAQSAASCWTRAPCASAPARSRRGPRAPACREMPSALPGACAWRAQVAVPLQHLVQHHPQLQRQAQQE